MLVFAGVSAYRGACDELQSRWNLESVDIHKQQNQLKCLVKTACPQYPSNEIISMLIISGTKVSAATTLDSFEMLQVNNFVMSSYSKWLLFQQLDALFTGLLFTGIRQYNLNSSKTESLLNKTEILGCRICEFKQS